MPNLEHLARLEQGADIWNAWRKANPDSVPQLRSARLDGRAQLQGRAWMAASCARPT